MQDFRDYFFIFVTVNSINEGEHIPAFAVVWCVNNVQILNNECLLTNRRLIDGL